MDKTSINHAINSEMLLKYKPKKSIYKMIGLVTIIDRKNNQEDGLCYQSEDNELYVRKLKNFQGKDSEKFEFIDAPDDIIFTDRTPIRTLILQNKKIPNYLIGQGKLKQDSGKWENCHVYSCSMGNIYCSTDSELGSYMIGTLEKEPVKTSLSDHYTELKDEPNLSIWNGDLTKIPEPDTLVSFETASCGDVNGVVTGYHIKWRDSEPTIVIELRYPNSKTTNCRNIEDLGLPLCTKRKALKEELQDILNKQNREYSLN